jgi:tetratricopeptide (TPR) repeat protein
MRSEHRLLAAKLAIAEGRHREALDLLDGVVAYTAREEAEQLVVAGQAFEGLDDVAGAHASYARAQTLDPALQAPLLRRAVLLYRGGDREGARLLLRRYVEIESGNPEAFYYLSLCELDPDRNATFARTVAILDGPGGAWSRELLRFLHR